MFYGRGNHVFKGATIKGIGSIFFPIKVATLRIDINYQGLDNSCHHEGLGGWFPLLLQAQQVGHIAVHVKLLVVQHMVLNFQLVHVLHI